MAGDINIAAAAQMPGESADEAGNGSILLQLHFADSGFAQIVHSGPGEVAQGVGIPGDNVPVAGNSHGGGFTAHQHPVGEELLVQLIAAGRIVVAADVQNVIGFFRGVGDELGVIQLCHPVAGIGHGFVDFTAHILCHIGQPVHYGQHSVDRIENIAGGIQTAELFCNFPANVCAVGAAGFGNFVADGIENYAGMVEVLSDEALTDFLPDMGEIVGKVGIVLAAGPHVADLIHYQHANPVAGIQEGFADGVVGTSDGIKACFFQNLYTAFLCPVNGSGADYAVVVVNASAPELCYLPVDSKAVLGVQRQRANTKVSFLCVQDLSTAANLGFCLVQVGLFGAPALCVFYINPLPQCFLLSGIGGDGGLTLTDDISFTIVQGGGDGGGNYPMASVFNVHGYKDGSAVFVCLRRGNAVAVRDDMAQLGNQQLYIPVNSCATVPAGIVGGGDGNTELVGFTEFQEPVGFYVKIGIAVQASTGIITVYIDHGVGVNAFKFEHHQLVCPFSGNVKFLRQCQVYRRVEACLGAAGGGSCPFYVLQTVVGEHNVFGGRAGTAKQSAQPIGGCAGLPSGVKRFSQHGNKSSLKYLMVLMNNMRVRALLQEQ